MSKKRQRQSYALTRSNNFIYVLMLSLSMGLILIVAWHRIDSISSIYTASFIFLGTIVIFLLYYKDCTTVPYKSSHFFKIGVLDLTKLIDAGANTLSLRKGPLSVTTTYEDDDDDFLKRWPLKMRIKWYLETTWYIVSYPVVAVLYNFEALCFALARHCPNKLKRIIDKDYDKPSNQGISITPKMRLTRALCNLQSNEGIRALYLGKGFDFTPYHTRALHNLQELGFIGSDYEGHGSLQLHALEKNNQKPVYSHVKDLNGHTIIFGTTGSGKTRAFELLISQAIIRNDVVIIIDPKGDFDLKKKSYSIAKLVGREYDYEVLDVNDLALTTNPFNLLGSSTKPTQIADKISSLMVSASGNVDSFVNYANEAICGAVVCLNFLHKNVSLNSIKNTMTPQCYYSGIVSYFIDNLIEIKNDKATNFFYCLVKGLDINLLSYKNGAKLKDMIDDLLSKKALTGGSVSFDDKTLDDDSKPSKKSKRRLGLKEKLMSLNDFYNYLIENVENYSESSDLALLFLLANRDEVFFSKVTAGIAPILNTLSLSNLDKCFSNPDYAITSRDLYKENKIFYAALHSMKDATLASYVGKLLFSDLSSLASDIYASGQEDYINEDILKRNSAHTVSSCKSTPDDLKAIKRRVSIFVDEASETTNEALVQLLNKSRGANFALTLATQSFSDLVKRTGNSSAANQIIANCNNMISLRVKDLQTADVITSTLPTTTVLQKSRGFSVSGTLQDKDANSATSGHNFGVRGTDSPLFTSQALMNLPDFEYVAKLADGRFIKGVFPIIEIEGDFNGLIHSDSNKNSDPNRCDATCNKVGSLHDERFFLNDLSSSFNDEDNLNKTDSFKADEIADTKGNSSSDDEDNSSDCFCAKDYSNPSRKSFEEDILNEIKSIELSDTPKSNDKKSLSSSAILKTTTLNKDTKSDDKSSDIINDDIIYDLSSPVKLQHKSGDTKSLNDAQSDKEAKSLDDSSSLHLPSDKKNENKATPKKKSSLKDQDDASDTKAVKVKSVSKKPLKSAKKDTGKEILNDGVLCDSGALCDSGDSGALAPLAPLKDEEMSASTAPRESSSSASAATKSAKSAKTSSKTVSKRKTASKASKAADSALDLPSVTNGALNSDKKSTTKILNEGTSPHISSLSSSCDDIESCVSSDKVSISDDLATLNVASKSFNPPKDTYDVIDSVSDSKDVMHQSADKTHENKSVSGSKNSSAADDTMKKIFKNYKKLNLKPEDLEDSSAQDDEFDVEHFIDSLDADDKENLIRKSKKECSQIKGGLEDLFKNFSFDVDLKVSENALFKPKKLLSENKERSLKKEVVKKRTIKSKTKA